MWRTPKVAAALTPLPEGVAKSEHHLVQHAKAQSLDRLMNTE